MTNLLNTKSKDVEQDWKNKMYVFGVIGGAIVGGLSALLYVRSAEESMAAEGEMPEVSTGTMLSLTLAAISLIRQIAESGKKKK
ncbi:hypothetical protein G4Y79_13315 [Phototrophicus methaneseepsis]|uniref:Uncharacterized protein n=1 Tax=Phototrophicus methaneseepsis TaxID=2710758 RepID=A0A7S8E5D8_9CHLR|nr:hypothetical protein [Phototrophicus methaneseepsis]QPC80691.1 hypothetical protein G4Y79_13315 [Phototrophicus methaneseepsis]